LQVRASKLRYQGTRKEQQDYVDVFEIGTQEKGSKQAVGVLSDGIGGLAHGGEASKLVNNRIRQYLEDKEADTQFTQENLPGILRSAADFADIELAEYRKENGLTACGTTLLITVLTPSQLHYLSIGDSILWVFTQGNVISKVNQEHVEYQNGKVVLSAAVVGEGIGIVDIGSVDVHEQGIARILLSSDGILTLSEAQVASRLKSGNKDTLQEIVDDVRLANALSQDNLSMILFDRLP